MPFSYGVSRFLDILLTMVFAFLLSSCEVLTTSCNHYYLYRCSVSQINLVEVGFFTVIISFCMSGKVLFMIICRNKQRRWVILDNCNNNLKY